MQRVGHDDDIIGGGRDVYAFPLRGIAPQAAVWRRRDPNLGSDASNCDREWEQCEFVKGREIVVNPCDIGQRQRLAGGKEIKGRARDGVGPGRGTKIFVIEVRDKGYSVYCGRDLGKLQRRQIGRDVLMLGILVGERTEVDCDRRRITNVDVGKIYNAADCGEPDVIYREARLW